MRPRNVLPDRKTRIRAPGTGPQDRRGRSQHRASHLVASQPEADQAGRGPYEEIDRGISAVEMAIHGSPPPPRARRFFVFPASRSTPSTLDLLQARGIVVFGADFWASDWNPDDAATGIDVDHRPAQGCPTRASSCFTTRKPRPRRCCPRSCAISGTTTITSSTWYRPRPSPTAPIEPEITCESYPIKAAFRSRYVMIGSV